MDEIINVLKSMNNDNDLKDFIEGILTPTEIKQINMRINLIKLLKKGIPQHEIADKLGIGIATVTRGSRMLKEGHFKYIKQDEED